MATRFLALFVTLGTLAAGLNSAEAIQVFIMAGQSNTEGGAWINEATPANQAAYGPDYNGVEYSFRYVDGDGTVNVDQPFGDLRTNFGYHAWEVSLGRELDAALPGEDIAIIKFASGGTSLNFHWNETLTNLYDDFITYVDAQVDELELSHASVELAGMFWHQGEADSDNNHAPPYGTRLVSFFDSVRTDLSAPNLNFVAAKLSETGSWALSNDWEDDVNAGIQTAADTHSYISTIATADDISLSDDGLHHDSNGHIEIGLRMADSYVQSFVIPEPSAACLTLVGMIGFVARRRDR